MTEAAALPPPPKKDVVVQDVVMKDMAKAGLKPAGEQEKAASKSSKVPIPLQH